MEKDEKLKKINEDVTNVIKTSETIKIETEEDFTKATEFLNQIIARIKRIEELRIQFTKPILDAKNAIDTEFKASSIPLREVEAKVKSIILDYRKKEAQILEKKRIEKLKEAEKIKNVGEQEKALEEVKEIKQETNIQVSTGTNRFKKVWTFDIMNEKLIPKKYLKVDEAAIRKAVREGERKIKGVKIYQEERISSYT